MSEELRNKNPMNGEPEQDSQESMKNQREPESGYTENGETQGEGFVMKDSAGTSENREPGKTPTEENPYYARSYRQEPKKEEWYEKERRQEYGPYHFASQNVQKTPKRKKEKSSKSLGRKAGILIGSAAIFGLVAGLVFQSVNFASDKLFGKETKQIESTTLSQGKTEKISASAPVSGSVSEVAKNAMPSIVSITGVSLQEIPNYFAYFGFNIPQTEEVKSSGSGIIVGQNDSELLIATNNHVVADADSLSVCFTNQDGTAAGSGVLEQTSAAESSSNNGKSVDTEAGTAVSALVKGTDSDNDLAVVSVKIADIPEDVLENIKVAAIGDSDSLTVGEQVVAIGNALGYGQSVTSGYVSALNKQVSSENANSTFIQTDAAINPGNSGGALLNMKGELVGINSAKISSVEAEGIGFAIPISRAQPILDNLMNKKTREKVEDENKAAYLGITCKNVTSDASQMYNMPVGVFVDSVEEGGPAEKAGIQNGDIIRKIDGTSVETYENLVSQLEYYEAGEKVEFVISRADSGEYKEQTVTVELGAKKTVSGILKDKR